MVQDHPHPLANQVLQLRIDGIWREAVGRLCCALAGRAETVERIFCGIPMTLRGDSGWN